VKRYFGPMGEVMLKRAFKLVGIGALLAIAVGGAASPAFAGPASVTSHGAVANGSTTSGSGVSRAPAAVSRRVVLAKPAAAAATPPCWTTFNPPAPHGAPLEQTYRNCNAQAIWVTAGYTAGGQVHLLDELGCWLIPVGVSITWYWPSTVVSANYSTVNCRYPA
jgi:hypothetical protein